MSEQWNGFRLREDEGYNYFMPVSLLPPGKDGRDAHGGRLRGLFHAKQCAIYAGMSGKNAGGGLVCAGQS